MCTVSGVYGLKWIKNDGKRRECQLSSCVSVACDEVTSMSEMGESQYYTRDSDMKDFLLQQCTPIIGSFVCCCVITFLTVLDLICIYPILQHCLCQLNLQSHYTHGSGSDAHVEKQFKEQTGKKRNYTGYQKYRFIKQWVTGEDAVLEEAEIQHEIYTEMKKFVHARGKLTLANELHLELKFRQEMQQGLMRPCQTSQK